MFPGAGAASADELALAPRRCGSVMLVIYHGSHTKSVWRRTFSSQSAIHFSSLSAHRRTRLHFVPLPPRPSPPDHTMRVALAGTNGSGSRWANVFWVRNAGGNTPSDTELNSLAAFIYGRYISHFGPQMNVNVTVQGCQIIYYGPAGLQIGGGHVENTLCSQVGQALPASAAICISWRVAQRYRGGHPRTYLPGMSTASMQDVTKWVATYADAVRVSADQFHLDINTHTAGTFGPFHLGTVSFVLRNEWRSPPVFRDFTPASALVDTRIDTQRRRLGPDV